MPSFADDILAIDRLDAVKTVLEVLRQTTGLRTALVARVTEDAWTACAAIDGVGYGIAPGVELDITTTF